MSGFRIFSLSLICILSLNLFAGEAKKKKPKKRKKQIVLIETPYGNMKARLYDETPIHKENFFNLIDSGYYDSTLFHRVINQFMIQGGGPDSKGAAKGVALGNGGPGYTLEAELNKGFIHKMGALAAARMGDDTNPEKRSSGSQFYIVQGKKFSREELVGMEKRHNEMKKRELITNYFQRPENSADLQQLKAMQQKRDREGVQKLVERIEPKIEKELDEKGRFKFSEEQIDTYMNHGGTPHLDAGYTVFGEIFEGMDVLEKIAAAKTDQRDRPVEDIWMTIKLVKK